MAKKTIFEEEDEVIKRLSAFRNKILSDKVVIENGEIKKVGFTLTELKDFAGLEEKIIDIRRKRFKGI